MPRNLRLTAGVSRPVRILIAFAAVSVVAAACGDHPAVAGSSGLHVAPVAQMSVARAAHSSTRLADGRVLIAGGCTDAGCNLGSAAGATAEIFDPAKRRFSRTGSMLLSRDDHRAVLLADGRVLIAGGWTASGVTATTEIYDPRTGRFTSGPRMHSPRAGFVAVRLDDGKVLLAGGEIAAHEETSTAEVFDPQARAFLEVAPMTDARMAHAATLLRDGSVLVAGGMSNGTVLATAEVYDPATQRFAKAGAMSTARYKASAVTLEDGRAMVIGGAADVEGRMPFDSTELFDARSQRFTPGPRMARGRYKLIDSTVILPGGDVVVAGGAPRPEVFTARGGVFAQVEGTLGATRLFLAASAIGHRGVLLTGGYDLAIRPTAQAWLID